MKSEILKGSVYISLFIQIVIAFITFSGMFIEVPEDDRVLIDILTLENVSQGIEAIFYSYIALSLYKLELNSVTPKRYFDWVITTPVMLITTILFMDYEIKKKNNEKPLRLFDFLKQNKSLVLKIVFYNFMMLVFGYLGEMNILDKSISIPIGFVFFSLTFYTIYNNYVKDKDITTNKNLFTFLLIVWGLYGVAAILPDLEKNISYNCLDIIAKNFYGLYIYFKVLQIQKIDIE